MEKKMIGDLIQKFIETPIYSQEITLNEYNHQITKLKIIFKPEEHPTFQEIGKLMDEIDSYTRNDDYGDLTELTMKWTTFHELGEDQTDAIEIDFNIDS